MGVEGQTNELDASDADLSFIQLFLLKDEPTHQWHRRAMHIRESLKAWKATLRKKKTQKRAQRLEDLSATRLSVVELTKVVECKEMWADFYECLRKAETGRGVSDGESRSALQPLLHSYC